MFRPIFCTENTTDNLHCEKCQSRLSAIELEDGSDFWTSRHAAGPQLLCRSFVALHGCGCRTADEWLGGIDGLTLVGPRELIAVQSGITPNRVVRIRLRETFVGVASVEVLDLAHPEHDQPTLGEMVGDDFLYVANSLWGAWDRDGTLVVGRELTPPVILRIPL